MPTAAFTALACRKTPPPPLPPRWSARTHTPLVPTTTYGLLVFQDPPNTISSFTDEVRVCPMGKE
jgi:hypothetical protein